jgi:hypothetical protein
MESLELACEEEGRDPSTLVRTFDLYGVVPEGFSGEGSGLEHPVSGTSNQIAESLLALGELGFAEIRCDVFPKTIDAIEALQPVVELVNKEG